MNTGTVALDAMTPDCVERAIAWLGAAVLLFGAVLWADRSSSEMTDFSVTYVGARIVYEGGGRKLYDLDEQQRTKSALFKHAQPLIFEHPPFEALILSPLGALSYRTAYLVWGFFNALIWLFLPRLLRHYLPWPRNELGYFSLWLLFPPLGVALYQGQSSLVVVLFVSLSFVALKKNQEVISGVLLAFALLKFQFAVPFALIFVLRRRWAIIKGFALASTVLAVLSFAAVGWQGILSYLDLMLNVARHPHSVSYGVAEDMATVHGFSQAIFGVFFSSTTVQVISVIVAAVLILFVASQGRRTDATDSDFDLLFAASLVVALATSVHMFTHDLSPLVLATLLVVPHFCRRRRSVLYYAFSAAALVLWVPPIYFALVAWHRMYLLFPVLLTVAITTRILASITAHVPWRDASTDRMTVSCASEVRPNGVVC